MAQSLEGEENRAPRGVQDKALNLTWFRGWGEERLWK